MEFQEKDDKYEKHIEKLFRKNQRKKVSINTKLKAI